MTSTQRDLRSPWEWLGRAKAATPLGRARWWLSLATLGITVVGVSLAVFVPGGHTAFQAGPVSSAHKLFQQDCSACHQRQWQPLLRFLPGVHARSVPDSACLECHRVGGHHENLAHAPDCADCHREHRGKPTLARVSDAHCLRCHSQPDTCGTGCQELHQVTGFPKGHPPFAERNDPGQLRFNHAAHVKPEGVFGPGRQRVRLDCGHCHHPDESGRYMRRVKYNDHCAACHPLTVQLAGHSGDQFLRTAWARFSKEPAPHVAPRQVRTALRARLEELARVHPMKAREGNALPRVPWPPRNRFAQLVWHRVNLAPENVDPRPFVDGQLMHVEAMLFDQGCVLCHQAGDQIKPRPPEQLPEYQPTQIPDRWLKRGRFRHDSHRMLACVKCHPATSSHSANDVLMPTMEVCASCHNPRSGARHDCVGCHSYHHRKGPVPLPDVPKEARGASRGTGSPRREPRQNPPAARAAGVVPRLAPRASHPSQFRSP